MKNYYVSIEVHGCLAAMVDAPNLAAAKRKILDLEREVDFMDISLTEVKPPRAVRKR